MKRIALFIVVLVATNSFAEINKNEFCKQLKAAKASTNQIVVVVDSGKAQIIKRFTVKTSEKLGQIFPDHSKEVMDMTPHVFTTKQNNIKYDYTKYDASDLNKNGVIDENEKAARMISMLEGVREQDVVSFKKVVVGADGLPEGEEYEDKSGYWGYKNYNSDSGEWEMEKKNGMDAKTISAGSAYVFVYPINRTPDPIKCN